MRVQPGRRSGREGTPVVLGPGCRGSRGWARRITAVAVLTVPLLSVFAPVLFADRQFAFRDAGHYYYPLLRRVQQEWEAGRWPLWAPEASAGTPLLGNPTAAVLYPGKLVFFLLPHPWAVRVFVLGHVALAFAAMWTMLRGWRVSATGAAIGGAGVCLRRAGAEPGEQRDLPGRRRVDAARVPRGRRVGPAPPTVGDPRPVGRAGDAGARRRPRGGVRGRGLRRGIRRRAGRRAGRRRRCADRCDGARSR